jgi:hypothetical protein
MNSVNGILQNNLDNWLVGFMAGGCGFVKASAVKCS